MINVSEMYRISGGCTIGAECGSCANFIPGKKAACINYPKELNFCWNPKSTACKYFRDRTDESGQMDIQDIFLNNAGFNQEEQEENI